MEEFLDVERKKEENTVQNILSRLTPDVQEDIRDNGWMAARIDSFASTFRNSFFVSLYSVFVSKLINECRERRSPEIAVEFADIYASDEMERVKKYFSKVLRTDFPSNTGEWETIQNYKLIRNCIVHAQGKLPEMKSDRDREKIRQFIKKNLNLGLFSGNEEVNLGKGFYEEACKTIEKFLAMVLFPDKTK